MAANWLVTAFSTNGKPPSHSLKLDQKFSNAQTCVLVRLLQPDEIVKFLSEKTFGHPTSLNTIAWLALLKGARRSAGCIPMKIKRRKSQKALFQKALLALDYILQRDLLVASNQGLRCRTSRPGVPFFGGSCKFTTFCNLLRRCHISPSFFAYSSIRWTGGASLRKRILC
jgi:hypothetical protein